MSDLQRKGLGDTPPAQPAPTNVAVPLLIGVALGGVIGYWVGAAFEASAERASKSAVYRAHRARG